MPRLLSTVASLFGPRSSGELDPGLPHYVVGDVHGREDLLLRALERIAADARTREIDAQRLVFVGDYVDRGPRSAQVLSRLAALEAARDDVVCLMGNHEEMMLRFLDAPGDGGIWLRNGGIETLDSYLGPGGYSLEGAEARRNTAWALRAAMGGQFDFLEGLALSYQSGNLFVSHAGADPAVPLDKQTEETLLWWRPGRQTPARRDGVFVMHGHTIVPEPQVVAGRIAIDTGAFSTGRLTVAYADRDTLEFLTVTEDG